MSVETLYQQIVNDTTIWQSRYHGTDHWMRVRERGLFIAMKTGGDCDVVEYFSILHDCMRENEDIDPEHGARAATYARDNRHLIDLDDSQFQLLIKACAGHTHSKPGCSAGENKTLATCWDADRLDIGRVGLVVDTSYLFTSVAKDYVKGMSETG